MTDENTPQPDPGASQPAHEPPPAEPPPTLPSPDPSLFDTLTKGADPDRPVRIDPERR